MPRTNSHFPGVRRVCVGCGNNGTKTAGASATYLSADSCVHTSVMSPTLRSTLVPSGWSAEEAARFEAPAAAVVSHTNQHIDVKSFTKLVLLSSIREKRDRDHLDHAGKVASPLLQVVVRKYQAYTDVAAGISSTCMCRRLRHAAAP